MQLQGRSVYTGEDPHIIDKRPRYLIEELRPDLVRNEELLSENQKKDLILEGRPSKSKDIVRIRGDN